MFSSRKKRIVSKGAVLNSEAPPIVPANQNTSGSSLPQDIPAEVLRWNWGAFLLNWVWGLGNNTWIALLCFVPFLGMIMPFVLGLKGSEWAWRNRRWESVDAFKSTQRKWAIAGLIVWGSFILLFAAAIALPFLLGTKPSEIYQVTWKN